MLVKYHSLRQQELWSPNFDSRRFTNINLFESNLKVIDDINTVRSGGTIEKL